MCGITLTRLRAINKYNGTLQQQYKYSIFYFIKPKSIFTTTTVNTTTIKINTQVAWDTVLYATTKMITRIITPIGLSKQ